MPIAIKKLGQKGGPKGQDKTMPLPKKKPRHANPKHPMNTEKTRPMASKAADKKRSRRGGSLERQPGGSFGVRKAAPSTGMAGGGKLKMVEKGGKKVPFFAADGKGKMAMGGMMKKKGMAKGGMMKKGYAKGGAVKVKSGDTLSQIAKKNGVTLKALLGANPSIKNANKIRLGQSIKLPTNMAGSKSSNPYAGIKRGQMADMDVKNKSEKRQRRATRSMQTQVKQGGSRTTPTPSKAAATKESKSGREAMLAKARKLRDSKLARRAGGGMMKKKGYAKGGMMKKGMAKGGVMRGTGAATKGKRFGRSG